MSSDEFEVKGGFSLVSNCLISFHFLRFVVSSLSSSFLFVAIQHDYNPRILLRPYNGPFLSFSFFGIGLSTSTYSSSSPCACIFSFCCAKCCIAATPTDSPSAHPPFSPQVEGLVFFHDVLYFLFVLISFPHHGPLGS